MPRDMVLMKWCDPCFAEGGQRIDATQSWTVGAIKSESSPALHLVDTCEIHTKQFEDVLAIVTAAPPFKREPPQPKPKVVEEKDEGQECPVCRDVYRGRSGLVTHIWSMHRPGEPRAVGQRGKCPECDAVIDTPQGFAAHRRQLHKWSAVNEALSGVKGFRLVKG